MLHGFAAAPGDPDIARSCRRTFAVLSSMVTARTGISDEELRAFFAHGMLINVMSAIDLLSIDEPWAQILCPTPEKAVAIHQASEALSAHHVADRAERAEVPA
jgi:hypothetical protein